MRRCSKCGESKPPEEFYRKGRALDASCKSCVRARVNAYREANQNVVRLRKSASQKANRAQANERSRHWVAEHKEQRREVARKSHARLRARAFEHYGTLCACCGTTGRLSIDHVNGDGREHRKAVGHTRGVYLWLARNNYPAGFQTLCVPCNRSKSSGDRCRLDHALAAES